MLRRYLETIRKAKVVINKLRRHIKELGLTCDFSVRAQSVLSSLSVNADSKVVSVWIRRNVYSHPPLATRHTNTQCSRVFISQLLSQMCKSVFKIQPLLLFIGSTVTWQFEHPLFISVCGYNFIAYMIISIWDMRSSCQHWHESTQTQSWLCNVKICKYGSRSVSGQHIYTKQGGHADMDNFT